MHFWRSISLGIKFIWKTINLIREIILNCIFFLIILLMIAGISLLNDPKLQNTTPESGLLVIDIEGTIVDSTPYEQDVYKLRSKLNGNKTDPSRENSLFELTQKIEQAATDPRIKGMVLKLDNFAGADLPSLQYLAKYLTRFKEAKKPIYAAGAYYGQKQYYLASLANKVYLFNQGSVAIYGLSANNFYFKSLLDNLKVNTHVFRVGTYKSAVEPFLRDNMSSDARSNTSRWLTAMWENYLTDISEQRERLPEVLVPSADIMLSRLKAVSGNMSDYALENGLVDAVIANYDFEQIVANDFPHSTQLSIYDYSLYPTKSSSFSNKMESDKSVIAVVFINGAITSGENSANVAGSETITQQLNDIGQKGNVSAVVVRINSPGGSVYASESIRTEIEALRKKDIPVVVSMGGMAASGGYWIATESDYIIANANTITGSIGIFGIIPTFENSLANLGIYTDGVTTSPLANTSVMQPLPDEMSQLIQMNIESGYDSFVSLVENSRDMSHQAVEKVAQGQVWLGQEAKNIGLVDELGDFDDAVKKAAMLASVSDYTIEWPQSESNIFTALLANYSIMIPDSLSKVIYHQLPISQQLQHHTALWDNLNDPQNRYIYCLNCADVN